MNSVNELKLSEFVPTPLTSPDVLEGQLGVGLSSSPRLAPRVVAGPETVETEPRPSREETESRGRLHEGDITPMWHEEDRWTKCKTRKEETHKAKQRRKILPKSRERNGLGIEQCEGMNDERCRR
jgi:hypothetical protein